MRVSRLVVLAVVGLCLGMAIPAVAADSATMTFYVAPDGNDANPGTLEKPFLTLVRARDAIRAEKRNQARSFAVMLRGGRYHLAEPFVLGAEDSADPGCTITYRAYSGETPVLVGGVPVTGWQPYKDNLWKASVPAIKDLKPGTFEMLEDDSPALIARSPNEGWFRLDGGSADPEFHLIYKAEDFDPSKVDASQLHVHLIHIGTYFSDHIPVTSVDPASRTLHTKHRMWDKAYNPIAGKCYQIENALSLVDAPGEFFADAKTGDVYYYPRANDIHTATIETSVANPVVKIESTAADKPVHDIVLEGLTIQGGNTQIWTSGVERITIKDCRLYNARGRGIDLVGASSHVTVTGCEIADCGTDGVSLRSNCETPTSGKANIRNHDNVLHNNYIHGVGRVSITACGIAVGGSGEDRAAGGTNRNVISHNLITDTVKAGVQMFPMWDIPRQWAVMNDNVIKNNQFARCVTHSWDGGAFYVAGTTDNTTFDNNQVADVWSYFNETWLQPEDRPDDICSVDFDPGMTFNTNIRNSMFFGANATTVETGRFTDETFLENNDFESPDGGGKVMIDGQWVDREKIDPKPFDESKVSMDFGLTKDYKYPYPKEAKRPIAFPFTCSFEGTLSPFFLYRYNDGLRCEYFTTENVKDGKTALKVDKDVFCIRYRHPSAINKRVSIWMYDDPTKKNALCGVRLAGPGEATAFLGVVGAASATHYVAQAGDKQIVSRVKRKAGWHELMFDFTSHPERGCCMSIDGWASGEARALTQFHTVDIGDPNFDTDSRGLGFDRLTIE